MLTIAKIQKQVTEYYGITVYDLKCQSRVAEFVGPRHVAMYICRKLIENGGNKLGYKKIGKAFNRDHSTVINAIRGVENDLMISEKLQADVDFLMNKLQCSQPIPNVNYIYVETQKKE